MRLERGELGQAEEELRALLARDELPAADRVGALALLARALRLTGRTAEAVMAVVSARALAADVGPIEEHGLRVELEAAETFATAGERAEAAAALVRAVGIVRAQAALIADDALRATYEQNVPEVRRVLELTRDGV
jgi:hypothetical protein